jgi:hypothetical protein
VRRSGQGLDASFAAFRGEGREFFLDILFHRMSEMGFIPNYRLLLVRGNLRIEIRGDR